MSATCTHFANLAQEVPPPANGILSRTLYQDDRLRVVVFGFAQGEELSEHTAAMPAVVQVIQGEVTLTLGEDVLAVRPGSWVHMPAGMRHAVRADTPAVLLLSLLKGAQ